MKILYISHEYHDRRLKYAQVLRDLGHDVTLIRLKDKKVPGQVTEHTLDDSYDVVWLFSVEYIRNGVLTDDFISTLKQNGVIFTGAVGVNVGIPFAEWIDSCRLFDIWFTPSRMIAERAKPHCDAPVFASYYGVDTTDYYPMNKRYRWDITFMGSSQTKVGDDDDLRARLINRLRGFNIRVFGDNRFRRRLHPSIKVSKYSSHKEQNKVYNQSKINLDIPYINSTQPDYAGKYHPKNRLFEIPASGGFLLEAYSDEFNDILKRDVHCGYYEPDEIEARVEYYLTHDEEREKIARAGYEHVLANYQNMHCFSQMVEKIEQLRDCR